MCTHILFKITFITFRKCAKCLFLNNFIKPFNLTLDELD